MNIYVGSLDFKVKEQQLEQAFAAYGDVTSVRIITDKVTRRSKGFAFVEMPNDADAQAAIEGLNGSTIGSRQVIVNESRPKSN
ncbi:MAG TPA: RNA-binding protein [Bacteroidales bacterium]|jgi:RNA recognition motif-containing protein|nr:RNA-binding protein [Bacteroidales bacterium]HRS18394.1 RNA-binding protein [Bacteroidales bacterium]